MNVWDTAGVERFRTLTRNYYRNAHAAVFIYSVGEVSSLHYLIQWEKDTRAFAPNAVRMLIGNKKDLDGEVDEFTAKSFAKTHAFELDAMVSCKTGEGVKDAIEELAKLVHMKNSDSMKASVSAQDGGTIRIDPNQPSSRTTEGGGGCAC